MLVAQGHVGMVRHNILRVPAFVSARMRCVQPNLLAQMAELHNGSTRSIDIQAVVGLHV